MKDTLCIILGGGQGSRLFPLTKDRSKPAVPIGGKYRLIDIPVSNCLNSYINRIYILTQFNSASLNKHVNHTYRFDSFHRGFVDILAAEQSMDNTDWYQGTADAVRKNLKHILAYPDIKHVLILSGDQIYTMDFRELYEYHIRTSAEVTVSLVPVNREDASSFGLVKFGDNTEKIEKFIEKPKKTGVLDSLNFETLIREKFPNIEPGKNYLASMGIYFFNIETLIDLLDSDCSDFGKEVIPQAIDSKRVMGYLFNGYWEDVGSIKTFWKANLDFTRVIPNFSFYKSLIYTNSRHLPASRIFNSQIDETIICDGSVVKSSKLTRTVVGIRSIVNEGCEITDSILMGSDFFESESDKEYNFDNQIPDVGIGQNCIIHNAIIDKNAKIGNNCKIVNIQHHETLDCGHYYIREGIIIIPKNAVIPDNTII
ncbi:MAG: glucose-1-phosphate adenylyltransferase [Spirochaetes bacterium GWF1_31_7]|nr:MAG: glucose-1-phosphate adenylyltransferase [Spirochaetes bacterium GWE1_32_154]OHD48816.1 MAG: glucose-1-phosphate adenylyltransferase [Spirochaetes bacterium GWE2_31_10]OHD52878.1 MAG: glucose-1-phosphate adenylyltransferase [Spirochaetes bacterium GWF1_31_7]OHD80787.1 MAG: glucose-1-phosphate adenylyltransferase [Spirochaetes bacterium RIFOXYB1_FULL_32_8]HBD94667.1 glucose-1-phosphate adenylyltransferase [Spirochaetia bacterium]